MEENALRLIPELNPEVMISSGGALAKQNGKTVYSSLFTKQEAQNLIAAARAVCGMDCLITADTLHGYYWNCKPNADELDIGWRDAIYSDFVDFPYEALKICVETADPEKARNITQLCPNCDCVKFSDENWYKFTPKNVTKERAILAVCEASGISVAQITAFGDDLVDIGMLTLCGTGVAMGNAVPAVRQIADVVIGSNDDDGVAVYLEEHFL